VNGWKQFQSRRFYASQVAQRGVAEDDEGRHAALFGLAAAE
jgi:hypothetical protein